MIQEVQLNKEDELKKYGFDIDSYHKARKYEAQSIGLNAVDSLVSLALVLSFGIWGSGHLYTLLESFLGNIWGVRFAYTAVFVIGTFIIGLPVSWVSRKIEQNFNLSNQTRVSWVQDQLKSLALSSLIALAIVPGLFWLISYTSLWWLWAWIAGSLFILFISFIAPTVLLPIFYNFERIEDEDLLGDLEDLAQAAGIDILGVFRMDASEKTEKANGGLTGIGSSRRIILSDTMLDRYSNEEIKAVMAHEMGHHKHNDIWLLLGQQSVLLLIGLFLASLFIGPIALAAGIEMNIAVLPFLLTLVGAIQSLFSPLHNWFSRTRERMADKYSMEMVSDPRWLGQALVKLSQQNLGNPAPHWIIEVLVYDHPSGLSRVKRAFGDGG